jgi:hypothetical protein
MKYSNINRKEGEMLVGPGEDEQMRLEQATGLIRKGSEVSRQDPGKLPV